MAKRQAHRQITKMIGDMEKLAKRLRAGVRQRAKSAKIPARLKRAAAELKKSAGVVSSRVEKHARRLRAELKGRAKGKVAKRGKKARRTTRRRTKKK